MPATKFELLTVVAFKLLRDTREAWAGLGECPLLDWLLSEAGSGGKDPGAWLRDDLFKQHCRLFHNRPFI